jgi:hypothetical protein
MSCSGEFPFGPGNPCTKCSKMSSVTSESEKQAIMVNMKLVKYAHPVWPQAFIQSNLVMGAGETDITDDAPVSDKS